MARRKSSTRISPWPLGANTGSLFWAVDCWDHFWSHLLLSVSLTFPLWSNLLKTFTKPLFSSWLGWVLPTFALASLEVDAWERVTSVPGLIPIYWVLIAIEFPPVYYICSTLGFLPKRCALRALGFSPICCKAEVCRLLFTSFLLVLAETEPWGERYALSWCLSFVCQDLWASRLFDGPGRASSFWGTREFIHYDKCIKVASTLMLPLVPWWLWQQLHFAWHVSIVVSGLLPQWLRVGYSASTLELVHELGQKFWVLIDAFSPSSTQV